MKRIAIQGEVGSFHDITAHKYFEGEQMQIVCCNTFEEVFDRNSANYYDGLRAHYWIHFCDEGLYAVSHTKEKRRLWGGLLLAAAFLVAGVLTVLFGE